MAVALALGAALGILGLELQKPDVRIALPASLARDGATTHTALRVLAAARHAPKGPNGEPLDP